MELRVAKKYALGRKLGNGAFGDIYLGVNIATGEEVAIKLEPARARHQQLIYESKVYRLLGGEGARCVFEPRCNAHSLTHALCLANCAGYTGCVAPPGVVNAPLPCSPRVACTCSGCAAVPVVRRGGRV